MGDRCEGRNEIGRLWTSIRWKTGDGYQLWVWRGGGMKQGDGQAVDKGQKTVVNLSLSFNYFYHTYKRPKVDSRKKKRVKLIYDICFCQYSFLYV